MNRHTGSFASEDGAIELTFRHFMAQVAAFAGFWRIRVKQNVRELYPYNFTLR